MYLIETVLNYKYYWYISSEPIIDSYNCWQWVIFSIPIRFAFHAETRFRMSGGLNTNLLLNNWIKITYPLNEYATWTKHRDHCAKQAMSTKCLQCFSSEDVCFCPIKTVHVGVEREDFAQNSNDPHVIIEPRLRSSTKIFPIFMCLKKENAKQEYGRKLT